MSWWKHILPKNTSTCWMFPGLKHTSTLEPARSNGFVGDAVIINSFVWVTWGNIIIHLHDLVGFFFRVYPLQNYSMLSQRCLVSSCNYFCRKVCRRVLFQHAFWKKNSMCTVYKPGTYLSSICDSVIHPPKDAVFANLQVDVHDNFENLEIPEYRHMVKDSRGLHVTRWLHRNIYIYTRI